MINSICWVPKLELFDDYENDWSKYETAIYEIFKNDFINNHPCFEGKQVNIRKYPMVYEKEDAFYHITCQDYLKNGERVPDFRRCERIRWVRAFIENYNCDSSNCPECDGVKVWREPYNNNSRTHILLEEERFIVVVEQRKSYVLLVTAFYIEMDHTLQKKLKHYEKYKMIFN